ncbi:MAG: helix-turn-helix domain-containing protein [Coxiellaceae bacterium]|nr:MAG: helix-turn-helix domain-containing protein [Coxiellaceae bacterium]
MAKHYHKLSKVLQRLLFERRMKPVDLAREVDLPQPTVHRLISGKSTRPYRSSLEPIAAYFSITVDQLLGEQPLDEAEHAKLPTKVQFKEIPMIKWDAIEGYLQQGLAKDHDAYVMGAPSLSDHAFATVLEDSSMEPVFPKNSTLIFDPTQTAKDRNYVLIQLKEVKLPIFRQLLIDGKDQYLKPLNPDLSSFKMRLLEEGDMIVAVLIEARTSFHQD